VKDKKPRGRQNLLDNCQLYGIPASAGMTALFPHCDTVSEGGGEGGGDVPTKVLATFRETDGEK
jgi:hypothetical protein